MHWSGIWCFKWKRKWSGVHGVVKQWIESHLDKRFQFMDVCSSQFVPSAVGVSQGSILGPIEFLLTIYLIVVMNCIRRWHQKHPKMFNPWSIIVIMEKNTIINCETNGILLNKLKVLFVEFFPKNKAKKSDLPLKVDNYYIVKTQSECFSEVTVFSMVFK